LQKETLIQTIKCNNNRSLEVHKKYSLLSLVNHTQLHNTVLACKAKLVQHGLRIKRNLVRVLLVFFMSAPLIGQEEFRPLTAGLLMTRLDNAGIGIQIARETAIHADMYPLEQEPELLQGFLLGLFLLELHQDYYLASRMLSRIEQASISQAHNPVFLQTLATTIPDYFGSMSLGLLFMRIPEYYVSLGEFQKAREWLSSRIPQLTDTREIHFAALVLSRILVLEGRFDQARTLLQQRFLQPLANGVRPPYGSRALITGFELSVDTANRQLQQQVLELMERNYPDTLDHAHLVTLLSLSRSQVTGIPQSEIATRQSKLQDQVPLVQPFPLPGQVLAGAQDFSLGLIDFTSLNDPAVRDDSIGASTTGTGSNNTQPAQIQPTSPALRDSNVVQDLYEQAERGRYIQVGSFSNQENASRFQEFVRDRGFTIVTRSEENRVRILVPVPSGSNAIETQLRLREAGIEGFSVDN
jgi:tetratricopeptide (TPR) repeat protein